MTAATPVLDLPSRSVGSIPFRVAPFHEALTAILSTAQGLPETAAGVHVHFANAYTIALADDDHSYAELLSRPRAAVFTDGMPVAWVGRRAYPEQAPRWDRVYGPDMMQAALAASTAEGGPTHYLLGGSPESLGTLRSEIGLRWPGARIVGAESPPYRPMTEQERAQQDDRIRDSGASVIWVGLGTPKQDWEAARLAAHLPVVALAVGAAFDFIAGTKPQAPLWMQRSGIEWTFRLASEPRRLARRYLWGNPRFLRAAARQPGLRTGAGEDRDRRT
jgi:N-acetylglucosaminyldiphosphoundecaprenol N-acetyl-beta-D-mannosaminyltransferase